MLKATDIDTLDEFKRNTKAFLAKLKKSGAPRVLTLNGRAVAVIQDAHAFDKDVADIELQDRLSTLAAIRQGIDELDRGLGRPAREVFRELRADLKKSTRRKRAAS